MEAAAHSQNICHYAIITTDNREQANFRLNRNYDRRPTCKTQSAPILLALVSQIYSLHYKQTPLTAGNHDMLHNMEASAGPLPKR